MSRGEGDELAAHVFRELLELASEGRLSPGGYAALEAKYNIKFNYPDAPAKVVTLVHPPPDDSE